MELVLLHEIHQDLMNQVYMHQNQFELTLLHSIQQNQVEFLLHDTILSKSIMIFTFPSVT